MKKHVILIAISIVSVSIYSCGNDDGKSCTTCSSELTQPFTLCEEGNGNASINGEDTGTPYTSYLEGLVNAGTVCGGE